MHNQASNRLLSTKRFLATLSILILLAAAAKPAYGQVPVISSLSQNGTLICTNLTPGASATIEWAPSVTGPWTNTWAGLAGIAVGSSGMIEIRVPMFYRVRSVTNALPEEMALIPAGDFLMGDANDGMFGEPQHTVTLSAYYMDNYEVTKAKWDLVYQWAITNGYGFSNVGSGKGTNHPVHSVNWYDMVKWCNARSEMQGRVPAYYTEIAQTSVYRMGEIAVNNDWVKWKAGYRLPTEAEWEKAARGGAAGHRFPWHDVETISHERANYESDFSSGYDTSLTEGYHPSYQAEGFPYTSPVGSFAPNGYGLYDMVGNLWEICWDWFEGYNVSPQVDPIGPANGPGKIGRGSSWNYDSIFCRNSGRAHTNPSGAFNNNGFRTVLPIVP
jgi:formylglycine-generating enzyme